jgi:hypothetical protein
MKEAVIKFTKLGPSFFPLVAFFLFCGTLGTAATNGLLYRPRMIGDGDCAEKLVE